MIHCYTRSPFSNDFFSESEIGAFSQHVFDFCLGNVDFNLTVEIVSSCSNELLLFWWADATALKV